MDNGVVGQVRLQLGLDNSGLDSDLGAARAQIRSTFRGGAGDTREFRSALNNTRSSVSSLGSTLKAAFSVAAIIKATKELVKFGSECINLGSNLSEVQNVVDVTFTSMSGSVNKFAKSALKQFGLSQTAAKKYAGTFGSMAKSFQFTEKEALDMSTALAGMVGDTASFYNASHDEAYNKLKSIFTGESESLKEWGIVMTQAALDQYALANGFGKTTAQMTEQEKVTLRYAFVMERLAGASGDYARTSTGWANSTRTLALQWEQVKTTLGQILIKYVQPLVNWLNDLLEKLNTAAEKLAHLAGIDLNAAGADALATSTEIIAENTEKTLENTQKLQRTLASFDKINKLGDAADLATSGTSNQSQQQKAQPAAPTHSTGHAAASTTVSGNTVNTEPAVKSAITPLTMLRDSIGNFGQSLRRFWESIEPIRVAIATLLKIIADGFVNGCTTILNTIALFGSWFINGLQGVFDLISSFFAGEWVGVWAVIDDAMADIGYLLEQLDYWLGEKLVGLFDWLAQKFDNICAWFSDTFSWFGAKFGSGGGKNNRPASGGSNNRPVSAGHIPHLANGAFVRANTPQLAVIGDNRTQGEIVAPEGKLQAMADAAAGNGNREVIALLSQILALLSTLNLTASVDADGLRRVIVKLINDRTRATGQCEIYV